MRELTRPITESQLAKIRRKAIETLDGNIKIEEITDALGEKNSIFRLRNKSFPSGSNQFFVPLGRIRVGAAMREIGVKLKKYHPLDPDRLEERAFMAADQETNYTYFKKLGFPVLPHYAIGEIVPHFWTVATLNLTEGGKKVAEAHNFDFSTLKNGNTLRQDFKKYVRIMTTLHAERKLIVDDYHQSTDAQLALKKTFHVQYDPKTMKGRLVMADLDHIKINERDAQLRKTIHTIWQLKREKTPDNFKKRLRKI